MESYRPPDADDTTCRLHCLGLCQELNSAVCYAVLPAQLVRSNTLLQASAAYFYRMDSCRPSGADDTTCWFFCFGLCQKFNQAVRHAVLIAQLMKSKTLLEASA